jgi:DNA (cytosine-5)-methyltransferase 1
MAPPQSPPDFRFIDLFAGIGGFHLALSELGGTCVMASEIDEAAADVYEKNHGLRPLGDIRAIDVADVPDHEVLAAGFPCQAFSKAGAQQGLRDVTRGTLFFEIARILEAKRPRFIILENVRNLARHDGGRTWAIIVQRLHQLGYKVSATPLIASPHRLSEEDGGAPHFRERVFILGELREGSADPDGPLDWDLEVRTSSVGWDPQAWDLRDWLTRHPATEDLGQFAVSEDELDPVRAWLDLARRVPDQLPGFPLWEWAFVDKPDLSDDLPTWKRDFHRKNSDFYVAHRPEVDAWRATWRPDRWIDSWRKFEWQAQDSIGSISDEAPELLIQMRPSGIRVKRPTYVPALVAITQTSILGWERRRMTPSEAATLQGLSRDFSLAASTSAAYKQLGNGVNAGVVRHLAGELFRAAGFGGWGAAVDLRPGAKITQLVLPERDELESASAFG